MNVNILLEGPRKFVTIESPLKMMRIVFYFILTTFFVSWNIYIFVLTFWLLRKAT